MIDIRDMRVDIRKTGTSAYKVLSRIVLYAVIIAGAGLFSLPFFWMARTAIMPPWQLYRIPPEWIPEKLHFQTLLNPWRDLPFGVLYRNTAVISFLSTLGVVISSSAVAYGFARLRFPGRDMLFMVLLSTMMLPPQVTLIPRYVIFSKLGWVNTFKPLIVPLWLGSPYNIFLLRQFFMTIPLEMDEAAKIDGCSPLGIYLRIILPLSTPALGAVGIMTFMWSWNRFLDPLIYLNVFSKFPLSVGLTIYKQTLRQEDDSLMAGALQALVPALALFFVAQRYFIQGIVITGVKG